MSTRLLGALTRPTPPARPVRPQVKNRQFGLPSEALVAELHGADNATAMSTERATTLPTPHAMVLVSDTWLCDAECDADGIARGSRVWSNGRIWCNRHGLV